MFILKKIVFLHRSYHKPSKLLKTKKLNFMNKAELVDAIAAESGLTKVDSKKALDAFIKVSSDTLKKGESVVLIGFATFSVTQRSARTGRNPQTGKPLQIKAKKAVKFKAGSELSKSVE